MSLEVFEVEEDWSCACISVRKRCVFDIISIAYARFIFIGLRLVGSVSGLLDVFWNPFGTVFVSFLESLGPILGSLGRPWSVLEGLGGLLAPSWGLLEGLLGHLGTSCGAS